MLVNRESKARRIPYPNSRSIGRWDFSIGGLEFGGVEELSGEVWSPLEDQRSSDAATPPCRRFPASSGGGGARFRPVLDFGL
ncbi:hypothetical protein COLO4_07008 [Corchorus olitorius]|uniref:Uncharacterized protein n=1 Tax=Corchorus olitorius TaxID=93759 RepID=A0A1R3KL73_9ROSI|nr:hypothetical protein COLO4_07008 [Corchorus olitorius]